jgi:hypothetical protein
MDWRITVGYGWQDSAPPEVLEARQQHLNQGKSGLLSATAHTHLEGFQGCGDSMFYDTAKELESVARACGPITSFLELLDRDEVDVASLLFLNFQPSEFSLSPRPDGSKREVPSLSQGLHDLLKAVEGSIRQQGMWSLCEWAMLTCDRR